jgi:hypothetical protein
MFYGHTNFELSFDNLAVIPTDLEGAAERHDDRSQAGALERELSEGDRMTELRCYLGLRALRGGKKNAARDHFRWVTEHGKASYTEYAISLIQLDRLEKK